MIPTTTPPPAGRGGRGGGTPPRDYRAALLADVERARPRWNRMEARLLRGRRGAPRRARPWRARIARQRPRTLRDAPPRIMRWTDARRELAYQAALRRRFALAVQRAAARRGAAPP